MKVSNQDMLLAIALISLAVVARTIPHPPNFTPVLAVALFGGATLRPGLGYAVPIAAMLLSDFVMEHRFSWMTLVVYACMAAGVALGAWLRTRRTWGRTALAAASGSLLFFIVTNFAVWASPRSMYAPTLEGLVQCYVLALPFFRNGLAGDLFWTAFLFGVFEASRRLREPRTSS